MIIRYVLECGVIPVSSTDESESKARHRGVVSRKERDTDNNPNAGECW